MPVPHSRRVRLVFLALVALTLLSAGSVQAKTPYTINKITEGDPGDGLLSPRSYDSPPFLGPQTDQTLGTGGVALPSSMDVYATSTAPVATAPRSFFLPTSVYVAGLGWGVLTPLWLISQGEWTYAP